MILTVGSKVLLRRSVTGFGVLFERGCKVSHWNPLLIWEIPVSIWSLSGRVTISTCLSCGYASLLPRGVITSDPCLDSQYSVTSGSSEHWHTGGMEPLDNPVYASEPVRKMTNGFGLTSMLLGFFNIALILIALVSFFGMVSAVNSANGVTIQDYEVLGEEEIERMFSEDAETAAPVAAMVAGLSGCLSVPVMLVGSILGFIGLMQSNAPKMGSILGLILNLPLLLLCGCGMVMGVMMPGV